MELWIRSQNKELLTKVDMLDFATNSELEIVCVKDGADYILGIYKTKERALEVLDEIQSAIEHDGKSFYDKKEEALYTLFGVYEMPKE